MVATRKSTRVGALVEAEGGGAQQSSLDASPKRTSRTVKKDSEAEDGGGSSQDKRESACPTKTEAQKTRAQAAARSRHRSGQSEADISEAESTASNPSTRVTRSRLRSSKSVVVTEPILESKDDEVLSEAESSCSSVSTRARRTRASISRPVRARTRRSAVVELDSDHSEAESHCSSFSGVQNAGAKSTEVSEATGLPSCDSQYQKKDISEGESSGFTSSPLIRRSTRRIQYKLQIGEDNGAGEAINQNQSTPLRKQNPIVCGTNVTESSSPGQQQAVLSSPLWSLRNRTVNQAGEVLDNSNADSPKKELVNADAPFQIVDLTGESRDEQEQCEIIEDVKESHMTDSASKDLQSLTAGSQSDYYSDSSKYKSVSLCLHLDSDSSEGLESSDVKADVEKDEKKESKHVETETEFPIEVHEESEHSDAEADVQIEDHKEYEPSEGEADANKEENQVESEHSDAEADVEENQEDMEHSEAESDVEEVICEEEPDHSRIRADVKKGKSHNVLEHSDDEGGEESSEESEDSEAESDVEMEEESQIDLTRKPKPKKVPGHQLQDMAGDGLFVIDTAPGLDSSKKYYVDHGEHKESADREVEEDLAEEENLDEEEEDFIDEEDEDELLNRPRKGFELSTSIDTGLSIKKMGGLYISFDAEKPKPGPSLISKMKKDSKKDELLKKSVITPDFEKKEAVPPYKESLNKLKKQRKEERDKTTGKGWFDMKAPELTEELKNDLKALKMRSAMDPKRFYKKNDREGFPKYFQVGTVMDSPLDHYHSRIPKKERKRTIVEELLADSEFRRYNKKKYQEIISEKAARAEGKKNRKKKKFRT
ncbi:deoxynucleotidyltransferase terminal-interacting protein 2 [Gastrophryne carolinensis]